MNSSYRVPVLVGAGLLLFVLGRFLYRREAATAAAAAVAAAKAQEQQQVADSLASILADVVTKSRRDSAIADQARQALAIEQAKLAQAKHQRDSIATRFKVLSDTTVLLAGSAVATPVPKVVGQQLQVDAALIAAQADAIAQADSALELQVQATASEHAARVLAEERAAAVDRVNQSLRQEVAALKPPFCGTTCGIIIGAVGASAAVFLAGKLH